MKVLRYRIKRGVADLKNGDFAADDVFRSQVVQEHQIIDDAENVFAFDVSIVYTLVTPIDCR
jgi:hypothetical protein